MKHSIFERQLMAELFPNNENTPVYVKLGLGASIESFVLFLIVGLLVAFLGGAFLNFKSNLPDWYINLIEQPIAFYYFGFLGILTVGLTGLFTRCGKRQLKNTGPATFIIGAANRAAISANSIACGMLIGLAAGLFLLSVLPSDHVLSWYARELLGLGLFCLVFIMAMLIPMMKFLDSEVLTFNGMGIAIVSCSTLVGLIILFDIPPVKIQASEYLIAALLSGGYIALRYTIDNNESKAEL